MRYRCRVQLRLRPWMLVSAAWLGPAILGGLDVIAQHHLWGEDGPVDLRRVLFVSLDWLLYARAARRSACRDEGARHSRRR